MSANNNGKGDGPRPLSIPKKEFDKKFDKAFPPCNCGLKTKTACEELRCLSPELRDK